MVGRAGQGRARQTEVSETSGYLLCFKSAIEDLFSCEVTVTGLRDMVLLGTCTFRKVQYLVSGAADMRDWGSSAKVRYEYSVLSSAIAMKLSGDGR